MINGAHVIVYSKQADADRAFLQDVIGLPHVDVGGGWLIFGLPASEVAVHPAHEGDSHELYFMVDDLGAFLAAMRARGHAASEPTSQPWGLLTTVTLPGGGKLGVYQPRHARPPVMGAKAATRAAPKKKAAKRPAAKAKPAKKPAKKPARRATRR